MKRLIQTGLILVILFSIFGCAKSKGEKFAETFVEELEFKTPYGMNNDFFISEVSPYYDKWTEYLSEEPMTRNEFLSIHKSLSFGEPEIRSIEIDDTKLVFMFYANINDTDFSNSPYNGRKKIFVRAQLVEDEWKLVGMAIF